MRTTSAFAARFRFVVWTLSCLSAFPSSLYTFSDNPELRSALARHQRRHQSVCRIWEVLPRGSMHYPGQPMWRFPWTEPVDTRHAMCTPAAGRREMPAKSSALTNWA